MNQTANSKILNLLYLAAKSSFASACMTIGLAGLPTAAMAFQEGPMVIRVPIGHAPLLGVHLELPPGTHAVWPTRTTLAERPTLVRLEPKAKILLRPGYAHTFAIVSNDSGQRHCATVEVIESLRLPPVTRIEDHTAPLIVHPEELGIDSRPRLITKAIAVLHNPAEDEVSRLEGSQPEILVAANLNVAKEACKRGRLIAVFRLGSRSFSDYELMTTAIPGTALLPGQKVIGPPAIPPYLVSPQSCAADGDPVTKDVAEEIIRDGGDRGLRAGIDNQGRLFGVDSEDAVASYTNAKGEKRLVHSNRVCIVAPRFQSLVQADPIDKVEATRAIVTDIASMNQGKIGTAQSPGKSSTREMTTDLKGRLSASANVQKIGPIQIGKITFIEGQEGLLRAYDTEGIKVPGRIARESMVQKTINREKTRSVAGAQGLSITRNSTTLSGMIADQPGAEPIVAAFAPREVTIDSLCDEQASSGPLELRKCCDKQAANAGDILTFTLRFSNTSGHPLKDIALVDALNPRLEYVEGTAVCSRDALFLQQVSEEGIAQLRWEVQGTLQPGDHAVVQFKVRVK